jgi:hypothetical protein
LNRIERLSADELLVTKWTKGALFPNTEDDPKTSIFAILDLKNDSLADIPIHPPAETLVSDPSKGYYLGLSEHYFIIDDKRVIFNFKFSPSIYEYNFMTKTTVQHKAESLNFPSKRDPIPADRMKDNIYVSKNYLHGIEFSNIQLEKKSGLIIRLASNITLDDSGNFGAKKYVQLFNSNFEIVHESPLNEIVVSRIQISNGYIYLFPTLQEEGSTRILKYEIRY